MVKGVIIGYYCHFIILGPPRVLSEWFQTDFCHMTYGDSTQVGRESQHSLAIWYKKWSQHTHTHVRGANSLVVKWSNKMKLSRDTHPEGRTEGPPDCSPRGTVAVGWFFYCSEGFRKFGVWFAGFAINFIKYDFIMILS